MNGGMGSLPMGIGALHLIDMHISMGNLVDLAAKQAAALPPRH